MALKLDLTKAITLPYKLARPIDIDGAFRSGALLAAMRVIAPCGRGDGFERHFGDATYPPDFAAADARDVDAYRAMGALFAWDGGESTARDPDSEDGATLTEVKSGDMVFQDVWRKVERLCPGGYDLETAARRGEVHSCLASKHPYRYWWNAFNRAVYELTKAFPVYERSTTTEDDEPYDVTIEVLPYVLSHTPAGEPALTPDDLCTPWIDLESAKNLQKVGKDTYWLLTAEDINFKDFFYSGNEDKRVHHLRSRWMALADAIGFKKYVNEDNFVERSNFRRSLDEYWRGKSPARYGPSRLAQLERGWRGVGDEWGDAFPYHGLAALLAYLEYFERRNVGFAVLCDFIDQIRDVEHYSISRYWKRKAQLEITIPIYGSEDIELEPININELDWGEVEKSETTGHKYRPAKAEASRLRPILSATALPMGTDPVTFYATTLNKDAETGYWMAWCDGDNNPFECFLSGGVAAMEDRLNEMAREALAEADEDSLVGTLTLNASLTAESSTTKIWERDWHDQGIFGDWRGIKNDDLPYMPHILDYYSGDYKRYFFIRTSHSCRIAKQYDFDIAARLNNEAGIPPSGDLYPILTDPTTDKGKIRVTLKGTAEKFFEVEESSQKMIYDIDLPNHSEKVEHTMPYIYANTAHGRELVFPTIEPTGSYELILTIPKRGAASTEVESEPSEELSDDDFFIKSSKLEQLHSISFEKYDEFVIYPS